MTNCFKLKTKYIAIITLMAMVYFSCRTTEQESAPYALSEEIILNEDSLANIGSEIVQLSFKTLSSKLTQQVKDSGAVNAIIYCNINAYPLMDSLSNFYGVKIKRTSYQIRNTENTPNQTEKDVLFNYHADNSQKKEN